MHDLDEEMVPQVVDNNTEEAVTVEDNKAVDECSERSWELSHC